MAGDHDGGGFGRDGAWFSPGADAPAGRSSPPGVVYSSPRSGPPRRQDPYQPLRDIDDAGTIWPLDDPGTPSARPPGSGFRPFLIGLVVGVVLAVVSVVGFQLLRPDESDTPVTVPAAGATTLPEGAATTVPATTLGTSTTVPSTEPPAVTTPAVAAPEIEAVGTPLDVDGLRLAANRIGPIDFGTAQNEALGRLVASLGPPDADTGEIGSTGEMGTCTDEPIRVVRWGPLAVVTVPSETGQVLGGFRVDLALGGLDSRAATIQTLSGLRAGDTVADLQRIYSDFTIDFLEEPELGLIFELRQAGTTDLLLWGPVTSADDAGRVTGIFSPNPCG